MGTLTIALLKKACNDLPDRSRCLGGPENESKQTSQLSPQNK
ncbi:hypothetical protein KR50_33290 [Jeotgalibacillus campisalis]|uniref:Uncharacterized protein n=1 Tax=Jeotgalibacillus campisalis TaxID=220754 RepID=A0A0C2VEG3_9BACL|nr:hypothetical protein KR50_33290 [Jeotgalibacillus campisalis]